MTRPPPRGEQSSAEQSAEQSAERRGAASAEDVRNWHVGLKKLWRDHVNPEIFKKDDRRAASHRLANARIPCRWIRSIGDQDEGTSVPMQELGRQIQASGLAGRMS